MPHLIDKDALVAEIKRILSAFENSDAPIDRLRASTLISLLSFIDTLEVKEVDLEKELSTYLEAVKATDEDIDFVDFAKHFLELGLKAQIMTSKLQQRISVLKMGFWTGLQTFEETEMTLSDAYNQGVDDILEELGLKAQKGE